MSHYNPRISIGIPVFNVENLIERCAVSLFEQTYANIEYVFVDDCTPDRSIAILESTLLRYPARACDVKVIHNATNLGSATTRNIILDHCRGEFILWVDSDDFIEPDAVTRLVKIQGQVGCDILGFGALKHSKSRNAPYMPYLFFTPREMYSAIMERKTHNALWGRLMRRSLFADNNIRFEDGQNVGEDFKVIVLLSYYAKNVHAVDDTFYHYDCSNTESLMSSFSVKKAMMTWYNIDAAKAFFKGKGLFYENAFKNKEAKAIVSQMITLFSDSANHPDFFKYLKKRARNLKTKDLKGIGFAKKLIYIIPSYWLAKSCCLLLKKVKQSI